MVEFFAVDDAAVVTLYERLFISMQKEANKFCPSTVFEGMVSIRALLAAQKEGHNDRKILRVLYSRERLSKIGKEVAFLRHEGERQGFTVEETDTETLESMTLGNTHGGLIAECTERTIPPLIQANDIKKNGFYMMLDGIEDPYNFGYALRSLYAMGVDGVILPPRSWMSAAGVVARAPSGASERFSLYTAEPDTAADFFKERGYTLIAADADTDAVLGDVPLPYPIFLVIGGEKRGISRAFQQKADKIVQIGYGRDFQAALSAASAATIFAYEVARQNKQKRK